MLISFVEVELFFQRNDWILVNMIRLLSIVALSLAIYMAIRHIISTKK